MPIIIEGGSRCAGWWWARHLQNTEKRTSGNATGGVRRGLIYEGLTDLSLAYDFRRRLAADTRWLASRLAKNS